MVVTVIVHLHGSHEQVMLLVLLLILLMIARRHSTFLNKLTALIGRIHILYNLSIVVHSIVVVHLTEQFYQFIGLLSLRFLSCWFRPRFLLLRLAFLID